MGLSFCGIISKSCSEVVIAKADHYYDTRIGSNN